MAVPGQCNPICLLCNKQHSLESICVLTVIMALVVVEELLWLEMHNGSRQLKEVISEPHTFSYACCCSLQESAFLAKKKVLQFPQYQCNVKEGTLLLRIFNDIVYLGVRDTKGTRYVFVCENCNGYEIIISSKMRSTLWLNPSSPPTKTIQFVDSPLFLILRHFFVKFLLCIQLDSDQATFFST